MGKRVSPESLGEEPVGKLLWRLSVPAAIGMLTMTVYQLVDTIFIGRWVGPLGIAGIAVVLPINMLISSIGMALGVGGASVVSRALGALDLKKANKTVGNLVSLNLGLSAIMLVAGYTFSSQFLILFGAKGNIFSYADEYFYWLLPGMPFLSWAMMSNNLIRSEGNARRAMMVMVIPAILNILLDPILIYWLDMGMKGAALATTISYIISAIYATQYFYSGHSRVKIILKYFVLKAALVKEVVSIGITSLARQGSISLLAIVINHSLFSYGGEIAVAIYGIVSRLTVFLLFPLIGLVQGFLPVTGFNYGAENYHRVKEAIQTSIIAGTVISLVVFLITTFYPEWLVYLFTSDQQLIEESSRAIRYVFLATPFIASQMVGAAYFQAIGKAGPALVLTLLRQGILLLPFILIFPMFLNIDGVWIAFPVADFLAAIITLFYCIPRWKKLLY
ncbi:MAG: MATE family efflux transporter [Cyclobacteriaceae bacterium]|nr:MATE family efflux transporter [Cyclobacteriaceae bacterium]